MHDSAPLQPRVVSHRELFLLATPQFGDDFICMLAGRFPLWYIVLFSEWVPAASLSCLKTSMSVAWVSSSVNPGESTYSLGIVIITRQLN